jgi:hypothetical protein
MAQAQGGLGKGGARTDVPTELANDDQQGQKRPVIATHFILANLAFVTKITDSARFKGDPIPRFQVGYFRANFARNVSYSHTQRM